MVKVFRGPNLKTIGRCHFFLTVGKWRGRASHSVLGGKMCVWVYVWKGECVIIPGLFLSHILCPIHMFCSTQNYYELPHCPQLFAQKSSLEKDITYTNIGRVNCKDILSRTYGDLHNICPCTFQWSREVLYSQYKSQKSIRKNRKY